jgi:hypothetical protein
VNSVPATCPGRRRAPACATGTRRPVRAPAGAGRRYVWVDDDDACVAHSDDVLTLEGVAIPRIAAFLDAMWVRGLGLPARWPGA